MSRNSPQPAEKSRKSPAPAKPDARADVTHSHIPASSSLGLEGKIHTMRGVQVMLDEDLAGLYGVETRIINRAVKRNLERFPDGFCFQMTHEEEGRLRSQFGILDGEYESHPLRFQFGTLETSGRGRHRKYLPYVFTEQGIAMLSAVLRSKTAVRVSIQIMQAFVAMRRTLQATAGLIQRLDCVEQRQLAFQTETDRKFEQVFTALEDPNTLPKQGIFYDGQIHDAHAFVSDLIRSAKKSIVLIDNYVDDTVLTMLGKRGEDISATIFTRTVTPELSLDLAKHNAQYPPIEVREFRDAHDRFFILDGETLYHLGASLKDLGKKWFAFSRLEKGVVEMLGKLNAEKPLG